MESVVLLTVDCLRRDHVGCYGYHRPTTPNIDAFAESATVFEGYANCPGTRWTFQTLHTGVLTARVDGLGIPPDYDPLANQFQQAGYSTAGFVDNGWVSRDYGYHHGFDKFYSVADTKSEAPLVKRLGVRASNLLGDPITDRVLQPIHDRWMETQGGQRGFKPPHTDAHTVDEALDWLDSQTDPYFLWIHFMDAHTPYGFWPDHLKVIRGDADIEHTIHPGKEGLVRAGEQPPQRVIDTYDAGIRYVDEQIGRVLDYIQDDATVVITGDHGEEFGTFADFHQASLHHTMTDVPLIVDGEGFGSDRDGKVAQHIDVPATLATAGGIEVPEHWDGEPLQTVSRSSEDPIIYTLREDENAIQRGKWKLIEEAGESKLMERVDGGERERTIEKGPGTELAKQLEAYWTSSERVGTGHAKSEMSEETEENLKDLGYL